MQKAGRGMGRSKKRPATMAERMRQLLAETNVRELEGGDAREQILLALVEKAMGGDLKTVEFILKLIGEPVEGREEPAEQAGFRLELGPGVEELAR